MADVDHYLSSFSKLRSDSVPGRWSEVTLRRAPQKPLLLLSVIDQFAVGNITGNLIELTRDLIDLYNLYWSAVVNSSQRANIALPFFHLKSEGFWHLIPRPGKENLVTKTQQLRSVNQLDENILGARLDDKLYRLLQSQVTLDMLRAVLIETYFAPEAQRTLRQQGITNIESFRYSEQLLEQARQRGFGKKLTREDAPQTKIRTQGFRRAVVIAYTHRCALCGIRVMTADGHTAVDAAHIIPWRVSYNDVPSNGLALCRLCHWAFDEGLISISQSYILLMSPQLSSIDNIPGHLATVVNRRMIGPEEQSLWPGLESLDWHVRKVFRKH